MPLPSSATVISPLRTVTSTRRAPAFRAFSSRFTSTSLTSSARRRAVRRRLDPQLDLATFLRQPVELDHLADHLSEVDPVQRLCVARGRGEPAERARDGVQPVDLRQHPIRRLFQCAIEIFSAVAIHPPQVLQSEPHGRERVLDLVGHLTGHLAPGQHPLRPGEIGDVVQGDDHAPDVGAQWRELHGEPPTAHLELGPRVSLRIPQETRDDDRERRPLRPEALEERLALGQARAQDLGRLPVRDQHLASRIEPYDPGGDGGQHVRGPPSCRLEGLLAGADVGRHALERAEYRLEFQRRVGAARGGRISLPQRNGRAAELGDGP